MKTISGNSYPVKEAIKAAGGVWDRRARSWSVPDEKWEAAQALVDGQGSVARGVELVRARRASRYRSNLYRFASGREYYVNKRGRCEDAPCCGCCS